MLTASLTLLARTAAAEIRTGFYAGTGAPFSVSGLGFQPDVVIVKGNENTSNRAVIRTSTMSLSKGMVSAVAAASGLITSLDADGFSLSTNAQVNQAGIEYYWIAFRMVPGESTVGSYPSSGPSDDRNITGLGFAPAYVVVVPEAARPVYQRSSAMVGDLSFDFDNSAGDTDRIQALLADGFQVGGDPDVNGGGLTYHYVAWRSVPGKVTVGSYLGDGFDDRSIPGAGFLPEYVIVKRHGANGAVHKPAATGTTNDRSLLFNLSLYQVDAIQALESDGFQVGTQPRVNQDGDTFYWMAFGPHVAKTNFRSIGTAPNLVSQGLITVNTGSTLVTKVGGTGWKTANRGRGDRLTVGPNSYVIASVDSEDQLTLTAPAVADYISQASYTIARQFTTISGWESCISFAVACPFFPVASASLVVDDRSEVGIAYKDGPFLLSADVIIEGSTTDATHTITLTADPGNRHNGVAGTGVVVDAQNGPNEFSIRDSFTTVEWLEFRRCRGAIGLNVVEVWASDGNLATDVLLQNLLVHDFDDPVAGHDSSGIALSGNLLGGSVKTATIRNSMIWDGDNYGIEGDNAADSAVVENVSIDGMLNGGIWAGNSAFTVRNTIVTSSQTADYSRDTSGSFSGSNNTSSDGTAALYFTNPLAATAAATFVTPNANLHLLGGASALDSGLDLSASFSNDIDGQLRPGGGGWDRGADEGDVLSTAMADLAVSKDDGQTSAVPGALVSYTITVTNNGPDTLSSLYLADPTPSLVSPSFVASLGSYDGGTGVWMGPPSLAATQSVTLMLSGTIDPFARGNLVNTATVSTPPTAGDPDSSDNTAVDSDTLDPSADVEIVKTDAPDPAPVGGLLTYTLAVRNFGPSGATNVTVTDPLPADMDLDGPPATAITPSQGSCNYVAGTRTVSCMLGNLAPAGVATITIGVRPGAARMYDNTASVTHGEPDPVAANDSDSETTLVEVSTLGVRFFTATSTNQRNVLEWVNPTDASYMTTEIMVRTDAFPTGPTDPLATSLYNANGGGSGGRWKIAHDTPLLTNNQTYYYGAFVHRAVAPMVSPGRFVTGRPFDHTIGPVKWSFATGATALAAPTVSTASIIATSNDKVVYAIERGTDDDQVGVDSGEWPASFRPVALTGVVQLRSPVVPVAVGPGPSNPVAYFGAQDGKVYVVDAALGGSVGFPWAPTTIAVGGMVQAAPAGIFSAFGSTLDYLLIGTRNGTTPNAFVALDPYTGSEVDREDNGGAGPGEIGIISGMAAVDYGPPLPPRAYFTNYERLPAGSTITLRCFELSSTVPVFNQIWAQALGDIASSPVLRGGRVLVGSEQMGGRIHSFEALLGGDEITFDHMNGQVRGFIFPDRLSPTGDMYFSTDDYVWGLTETGGVLANKFTGSISLPGGAKPSPVLFVPGSHYLYVGGGDGTLYEIDTLQATPVPKPATLGAANSVVGAPSYDREHGLVIVGTEAGIFYAVSVPLP